MTRVMCAVATVVCLALPAEAGAQAWELGVLFGATLPSDLDRRSSDLDQLDIRSGYTWGLHAAHFLTPRLAAEVLWVQQGTALEFGARGMTADLFSMTIDQVHGNAVYYLRRRDARTRPFVFAGLGATFLNAVEQPGETKLSFGFGGGAEMFFTKALGVRGQFRYKPTLLGDGDAGKFCDPFGFCQGSLQQIEFSVGAVMRF